MIDESLKAALEEQLAPLGAIVIRRMFGGAGVFLDGLMLGLIDDGLLYLKVDEFTQAAFDAEGLPTFSYMRLGMPTALTSYRRAPERLLDEPEELVAWASRAHEAARRQVRKQAAVARRKRKPDFGGRDGAAVRPQRKRPS